MTMFGVRNQGPILASGTGREKRPGNRATAACWFFVLFPRSLIYVIGTREWIDGEICHGPLSENGLLEEKTVLLEPWQMAIKSATISQGD